MSLLCSLFPRKDQYYSKVCRPKHNTLFFSIAVKNVRVSTSRKTNKTLGKGNTTNVT